MQVDTPILIAIVAALGTALGAILTYVSTMRIQQTTRAGTLEDNQRELIEVLNRELRETRVELRQTGTALGECKREIIGLLEQVAGLVQTHIDSIEDRING